MRITFKSTQHENLQARSCFNFHKPFHFMISPLQTLQKCKVGRKFRLQIKPLMYMQWFLLKVGKVYERPPNWILRKKARNQNIDIFQRSKGSEICHVGLAFFRCRRVCRRACSRGGGTLILIWSIEDAWKTNAGGYIYIYIHRCMYRYTLLGITTFQDHTNHMKNIWQPMIPFET